MNEIHDVVKLLLARMESHPEEFMPPKPEEDYIIRDVEGNRWWRAMSEIQEYGTAQEKEAIAAKLRVLRLQQAHEWAMDELCNGEDRRRKQRQQEELDKQRYAQSQMAQAQIKPQLPGANAPYMHNMTTALQQQMDYQTLQAISQLNTLGNYTASTDFANDSLVIRNHDTRTNTAVPRDELATASSPLSVIKKALGL